MPNIDFGFVRDRRRALMVGLVGSLVLVTQACSGDGAGASSPSPSTQQPAPVATIPRADLHVDLDEWTVAPSTRLLASGTLRFSASNLGKRPHDLVIVKVSDQKSPLPIAGDVVDETKVTIIERFREFKSGEKEKSITLESGLYLLICNIPGHYQQGMVAEVSVR